MCQHRPLAFEMPCPWGGGPSESMALAKPGSEPLPSEDSWSSLTQELSIHGMDDDSVLEPGMAALGLVPVGDMLEQHVPGAAIQHLANPYDLPRTAPALDLALSLSKTATWEPVILPLPLPEAPGIPLAQGRPVATPQKAAGSAPSATPTATPQASPAEVSSRTSPTCPAASSVPAQV